MAARRAVSLRRPLPATAARSPPPRLLAISPRRGAMEAGDARASPPPYGVGCPRWSDALRLLTRGGPSTAPDFTAPAAADVLAALHNDLRVLVVGAGGLGCELLKDLALAGFGRLDVIDMDTIDVSNLNRQFLFRAADVGKPKAEVAAAYIRARVPGVVITPHVGDLTRRPPEWYAQFHLIVAGLDSIDARRWLNATLVSLVDVDAETGEVDRSGLIPWIDGGSEGLMGQARVILPRLSACFECTLSMFDTPKTYPLCTLANTPRLPEHCVEYAHVVEYPRAAPFGPGVPFDADHPDHLDWLTAAATARADRFSIRGVSRRLAAGVVKHIVPAVASTNAVIAAACAAEAWKLATSAAGPLRNYVMFNGTAGVYSYTYETERRADCEVCGGGGVPRTVRLEGGGEPLEALLDALAADPALRTRAPVLRVAATGAMVWAADGPPALVAATRDNAGKRVEELLERGGELVVTDRAIGGARTVIVTWP